MLNVLKLTYLQVHTWMRVDNRASQPYQVILKVNNQPAVIEIDTGATVTVMSSTLHGKIMAGKILVKHKGKKAIGKEKFAI